MADYEYRIADEEFYRDNVDDDSLDFPGSIFYHPEFLTAAREVLGLVLQPSLCMDDGRIAGLANIFSSRKHSVTSSTIPHLFQYYGPVSLNRESVFAGIASEAFTKTDTVVLSLTPEESPKADCTGWKVVPRITYYLPPGDFDLMKNRCADSVKNKLNKAIKAGITVSKVHEFPWDIYVASFVRRSIKPPLGEKTTCEWVRRLTALKLAETFIAYYNDKPVAFRTQLRYQHYAYDWLAGSLIEYGKYGINQFLMLKISESHHQNGVDHWDLLGGDIKSIGDFKKSFGSQEKSHVQLEKNFNWKGAIYRRLMKRKAAWLH